MLLDYADKKYMVELGYKTGEDNSLDAENVY